MRQLLVIDVGGNKVKLWHSHNPGKRIIDSGEDLTPEAMVKEAWKIIDSWSFDAIALGLPCRVIAGRPVTEPRYLGGGWTDFDFAEAFERPVRIMNDAALQALGAYDGGRMLFLGLGTAVGSALIVDGVVIPLELGSLLHDDGEEIVHLLGRRGENRLCGDEWQEALEDIIPRLQCALLADYVVIGGGQATKLDPLPRGARLGSNKDVVRGAIRLWNDYHDPVVTSNPPRIL